LYSNIPFTSTFVQLFDEFFVKPGRFGGFRALHWGLKARFAGRDRWVDAGDGSVREKAMRVEAEIVEDL